MKELKKTLLPGSSIPVGMVQHTLLEEAQAILAAVVGGARYGIKIRIPHALVMTVLFRRDLSGREKIRSVLKLAMEHASNLAMFAAIYKVRTIGVS